MQILTFATLKVNIKLEISRRFLNISTRVTRFFSVRDFHRTFFVEFCLFLPLRFFPSLLCYNMQGGNDEQRQTSKMHHTNVGKPSQKTTCPKQVCRTKRHTQKYHRRTAGDILQTQTIKTRRARTYEPRRSARRPKPPRFPLPRGKTTLYHLPVRGLRQGQSVDRKRIRLTSRSRRPPPPRKALQNRRSHHPRLP